MTTRIDLGFPKLLPITGSWTLPFAGYLAVLTNRIVYHRLSQTKYLGDSNRSEAPNQEDPDPLFLATRAHGNFLENVPLALLFTAVAELNGGNRRVLNYGLALLFALRIAHVEIGLKGKDTVGLGRPVAYYGTQGFLVAVASYSAYLVKGYWGF